MVSVDASDDQEQVAQKVAQYDLHAIPVVDNEHHMLGIITHDDVIDVVRRGSDRGRLSHGRRGAAGRERELSGNQLCHHLAEANRVAVVPVRGRAIHLHGRWPISRRPIEKIAALSLFVPLCISTGGNSGSQAATLITRAMALGQVTLARLVARACGTSWRWAWRWADPGADRLRARLSDAANRCWATPARWSLAMVIAQAVTVICLWGTLVGSMLPLVFKRLGFDPGYASSPFVATFVDVTGIIIYFSIAQVWLLNSIGGGLGTSY